MKAQNPAHQHSQRGLLIPEERGHPSRHQHHVHPITDPLHVITVVSNSNRYYSRYKLYQQFERMVEQAGGVLWTVELVLRDRHPEVTHPDNPHHLVLRSPCELWHKENLINVGVNWLLQPRQAPEAQYIAWVDADVAFVRPDWVNETLQQLQHYKIVQMFSHATDLKPNFEPLPTQIGFVYSWMHQRPQPARINSRNNATHWRYPYGQEGSLWHPGYAWAARRSALADLGGLGDIAILGSADHHMACALIGRVKDSIHRKMHPSYHAYWQEWERRAECHIGQQIGYVSGQLYHYWHGPKTKRGYVDRWRVLVDEQFDYQLDIKEDVQGLYAYTGRNRNLAHRIRQYFRQRDEDDIRVD
jgi:hypothetical protein